MTEAKFDNHVTAYRLEEARKEHEGKCYSSADAYYAAKDHIRALSAALVGKKAWEHDPMGYWFGMQSN